MRHWRTNCRGLRESKILWSNQLPLGHVHVYLICQWHLNRHHSSPRPTYSQARSKVKIHYSIVFWIRITESKQHLIQNTRRPRHQSTNLRGVTLTPQCHHHQWLHHSFVVNSLIPLFANSTASQLLLEHLVLVFWLRRKVRPTKIWCRGPIRRMRLAGRAIVMRMLRVFIVRWEWVLQRLYSSRCLSQDFCKLLVWLLSGHPEAYNTNLSNSSRS